MAIELLGLGCRLNDRETSLCNLTAAYSTGNQTRAAHLADERPTTEPPTQTDLFQ